jgi:uncharacterized protein (UPF0303 family)
MIDLFRLFARTCTDSRGKDYETTFDLGCNIEDILMTILNWLAVGVTIAVVGGVIYGAVLYTSAAGNAEQAKRAMGVIRNAFVALLLYFAMWAILNWLVPGGLFN